MTVPAAASDAAEPHPVLPWLIAATLAVAVVFLLVLLIARDRREAVATGSSSTTVPLVPPGTTPTPTLPPITPPTTAAPPTSTPPTTAPGPSTPPDSGPAPSTTTVPEDEPASRYDPLRSARQTLNAAPVGPPTRLWRSMFPSPDFETALGFHDQPTADVMVVNAASGLFVLNPEDGAILWQTSSFDTDFRVIDVGEDDVVVASAAETWVVDREEGEDLWRAPVPAGATVSATEDSVVLARNDGFEVFDRSMGERRWDESGTELAVATDATHILAASGGQLRLFDRVGVARWSVDVAPVVESWLLDGMVVILTSPGGRRELTTRDLDTGAERWSRSLEDREVVNIASDEVIVVSTDERRTGFDAATGAELWSTDVTMDQDLTTDDHDGLSVETRGLDEIIVRRVGDGGVAWPQRITDRGPSATGDRIVMVLSGTEVIGFDLVTGTELWRVEPEIPDAILISAIESGFVVANASGEVEGWRLAGGGDATSKA